VQTANTYHFKKASASMSTNSRMTNVYYDMLYAGYIPGRTPLVIDGMIPIARPEGFDAANAIHGGGWHNTITDDPKSMQAYFKFYLGDNANFCSDEEREEILQDSFVRDMPVYPNYGYIDFIGDIMVINLL